MFIIFRYIWKFNIVYCFTAFSIKYEYYSVLFLHFIWSFSPALQRGRDFISSSRFKGRPLLLYRDFREHFFVLTFMYLVPDVSDACAKDPCRNNGTCTGVATSYYCTCLPGTACGQTCLSGTAGVHSSVRHIAYISLCTFFTDSAVSQKC